MDKHYSKSSEVAMPAPISDEDAGDQVAALFAVASFATVLLITLTEQYGHLPPALAALAASWWVIRL